MKTRTMILLIAGLACGAGLWSAELTDDTPVWHADWPTAQRIAKKTNKPIFAVMTCKH